MSKIINRKQGNRYDINIHELLKIEEVEKVIIRKDGQLDVYVNEGHTRTYIDFGIVNNIKGDFVEIRNFDQFRDFVFKKEEK